MSQRCRRYRCYPGFTLVELLVVIGIIAVLIGVLLPALSAARRQAATVKCAAALREIGNCFKLYEFDSKGYYPVARLNGWKSSPTATATLYTIDDLDYPLNGTPGSTAGSAQAHWYIFLTKYATKSKIGNAANTSTGLNAGQARAAIFYGCPAFAGYTSPLTVDEHNLTQTGFGMNPYPTFDARYPTGSGFPPSIAANVAKEVAIHDCAAGGTLGNFLKARTWTHSDRRMLVADSGFWLATSNGVPVLSPPVYPPAVLPQIVMNNITVPGTGQTYIDIYRHGKFPSVNGAGNYDPSGGRFGYNILYADGHVVTTTSGGKEAYLSTRMRFPN